MATHSDLSLEIQIKVDKIKVLRDIRITIGYKIDSSRDTIQFVNQKFVPKALLRAVLVTASIRKTTDLSIMCLKNRYFVALRLADLQSQQNKRKKLGPEKPT